MCPLRRGDTVPHPKCADIPPNSRHRTRDFMSQNSGKNNAGLERAVANHDVVEANPTMRNLNDDLLSTRCGIRHRLHMQNLFGRTRRPHNDCSHGRRPNLRDMPYPPLIKIESDHTVHVLVNAAVHRLRPPHLTAPEPGR